MGRSERSDRDHGWWLSLLGVLVLVGGGFLVGLVVGVVSEEPELVVGHLVGRSEEVPWLREEVPDEVHDGAVAEFGSAAVPVDPAADRVLGSHRPDFPRRVLRRERVTLAGAELEPAVEERAQYEIAVELPSLGAPEQAEPAKLPPVASGPKARSIDSLPTVEFRELATAPLATGSARTFAVQVGAFSDEVAAERVRLDLLGKGYDVYVVSSSESGDGRARVRVGPILSKPEANALADRLKRDEHLPTWVLTGK